METTDELWQAIEASGKGEVYVGRSVVEALAKPGDEASILKHIAQRDLCDDLEAIINSGIKSISNEESLQFSRRIEQPVRIVIDILN